MFKLAGMILLMTGCIGFGICKVSEEKTRIRELHEIQRIVLRMQNEMVYGKRTLPEICQLFGQCMKMPYQRAFLELFHRLEENDGTVLECMWKEQMDDCMKGLPLKEEEKNVLRNLPEHLGILDERMQAADIGQSLDIITGHMKRAEMDYESKTKVIMSISVMAGLFLVILLL